jgi:hypothetical protein
LRGLIGDEAKPLLLQAAHNFVEAHAQLRISPVAELPLIVAASKTIEKTVGKQGSSTAANISKPGPAKSKETFPVHEKGHIKMTDVDERWNDILARVRQYNQSLLTALKLAKPVGTINGSLTISFPYKFHAEAVGAAKNRLVVERAVEEVLGYKTTVYCVAQKDERQAAPVNASIDNGRKQAAKDNDLLDSALEILGGEVIK